MISRNDWGARSPRNSLSYISGTRGVKIHYTGGAVSTKTLTDHSVCITAVRGIQNGHMNGNGWSDIGYSMVACPHDFFVGRGPHKLPAANGPGLNSQHYAVLVLVGNSGVVTPTDAHRRQAWKAIDYLRANGNAGNEIKGHRDGYSTDCPGDPLYALVRAGFPRPAGSSTPTPPSTPVDPPTTGDDMSPEYLSFGLSSQSAVDIPAGDDWTPLRWDTEYADPSNDHPDGGSTLLKGDPSVYSGEFGVTFEGLAVGDVVQIRTAEYQYDGSQTPAKDVRKEVGDPTTTVLYKDLTAHHSATGSVQEGRKLWLEVRHSGTGTAKAVRARGRIEARQ